MADIVIKNGFVYDPLTREKGVRDLALSGGLIAAVSQDPLVIDAGGCLVVPGLIDFHVHCFTEVSDIAVDADSFCLPGGVTSCVDAGTAGTANFETAYRYNVCPSAVNIKALLDLAPEGQISARHPENQDPRFWDRDRIRTLVKKYPGLIKGLKIRLSANVLEPFKLRMEPLTEGIRLAEELGLPLTAHVNDPPVKLAEIASALRPGDVFCHMYAGAAESILDGEGRIKAEIKAARDRGVLFDAANGRNNFLFKAAVPAIKQGFLPDVISTDNNKGCYYRHPVVSLPRLLSKYLAMGMDLYDVIDTVTINPALWLGDKGLASLEEGSAGDIAVFKVEEKSLKYYDSENAVIEGNRILVPQCTIKNGEIAYCQSYFL
jgi:dihydroorotase